MEGSKGCQEPGGGLAMCVMCQTKLSMSSSMCELSVKSQSPLVGSPALPFIDQGGSRGYRWEKEENTKGIEGPSKDPGLPFSLRLPCITWQIVSEVACSLIFVSHALAFFSKWVRPIPPPRAACRIGLLNSDPVGSGCHGDCSFWHIYIYERDL